MAKYRKKPVVIEAIQLNWENWSDICNFLGGIISEENPGRYQEGSNGELMELTIPTIEGNMVAKHNDWIIKGVNGEFYPCKPDIFEKTYEAV